MPAFPGFPPETVTFLRELRVNNNKEWFEAHRAEYERACVDPARAFVTAAGEGIRRFAPHIVAEPRIPGSIFGINRDTRFSRDKTPYKDHLDFWFWEGVRKGAVTGFFARVTPEFIGIGAGCHRFESERRETFRRALTLQNAASEFVEMARMVEQAGCELLGEQYRRDPPAYGVRESAARYLRFGALFVHVDEPLDERLVDGRILQTCLEHWQRLAPLHRWLIAHVQGERAGRPRGRAADR